MIVAFRNFFRNHMVNLTARSVRHFWPDARMVCFSFYKHDPAEYDAMEPLLDFIEDERVQTKYVNTTGKPQDHEDSTQTAGYGNTDNVLWITESFNVIHDWFRAVDDKVLMLFEDHFFTTGKTLRELEENDFDLAYAEWDKPRVCWYEANASIVCMRPARYTSLFPLEERKTGELIETILGRYLVLNTIQSRLHRISTRSGINYGGDGIYTNSSADMRWEMMQAGLI